MRTFIAATILAAGVGSAGLASAQQTTITTTSSPMPAPMAASSPPPMTTTTTATMPATTTATTTTGAIVPTNTPGSLDLPAPETTTSPVNRPLLTTGILLLGGTYGASAIDGALSGRNADKNNLYYPVVGPWMDYANRGGCPTTGSCGSETGYKALLILDGIGQGLGVVAIVTSLFIPEKSSRNWFLIGNRGLHAAPVMVGTGYGLGAGGNF
jgi:hypothetical protein